MNSSWFLNLDDKIFYNLFVRIDQEASTSSNKAYFIEDPVISYSEEIFDELYFCDIKILQKMVRDLLGFMCCQDLQNVGLHFASSMYPFPQET